MTAPLSHPLREALREPFSDADVAALWPAIERRRERVRFNFRAATGLTLATAAAALAVALTRPAPSPSPRVGPLHLASGAPFLAVEGTHEGSAVTFDDRSRLALSPGARVVARANSARVFDTELLHGRARFDVTPRGPRQWTIDCGFATVRVVGTSFVLERSPGRLHVEVLHGLVKVEGERVPGRAKLLRDGESLDVLAPAPPPPTPEITGPPTPDAPVAPPTITAPAPSPPRPPRTTPSTEAWRALAAQRQYASAYEALGPGGTDTRARSATADDLLALGEVAHRSRHYSEAAGLYARFVTAHASHPHASMVAFTLGRIQLDQLGAPGDAARSFDTALRLGVPRDLQEDVHARRVEAHARAGDAEGARAAAEAYHRAFPEGRRAADVRRWAP